LDEGYLAHFAERLGRTFVFGSEITRSYVLCHVESEG